MADKGLAEKINACTDMAENSDFLLMQQTTIKNGETTNIVRLDASASKLIHQAELSCFPQEAWSEEAIFEALLMPCNFYYGIFVEQELACYMAVRVFADEAELLNIATLPPYRQQGLAKTMLKCWIVQMKNLNLQQIFLEVRTSNHIASSFYETLGFQQISVRTNYYKNPKEDAKIMCLKLAES